jgi:hypothetical protein
MIPFHDFTTSCVMALTNEHCLGSKINTIKKVRLSNFNFDVAVDVDVDVDLCTLC